MRWQGRRGLTAHGKLAALLPLVAVLAGCATVPAGSTASGVRSSSPTDGPPGASASAQNAGAPPARANAAFAFDADRHVMVLFGGGPGPFDDTWTWNGQGWHQEFPADNPPGATDAAMADDTTHHQMVLYVPGPEPQTWTWDGLDWTQQHPAHTPPSRADPAMAADPWLGGVILVGGTGPSDQSDVWGWDGGDWTEVVADQGPLFGAAHALAVSPQVNGMLTVIGNVGVYQLMNGTWSSAQVSWPSTTGYVGNVAYAPGAGQVGFVRFGPGGETWTWQPGRDSTWVVRRPRLSPPARWINGERPAMAYDAFRDVVVLFGGLNYNDTWTFDGSSWTAWADGTASPASPSRSESPAA